jgi:hypothetical protein
MDGQPAVYLYIAALEVNVLICRGQGTGLDGARSKRRVHDAYAADRSGPRDSGTSTLSAGIPVFLGMQPEGSF